MSPLKCFTSFFSCGSSKSERSMDRTGWPLARRKRQRLWPRKPAPPVTRKVSFLGMAGARTFSFIRFYGERLINLRTKSPVVKAVGILPGQAGSVSLLDVSFPEDPGPSQVLVKVLQNE